MNARERDAPATAGAVTKDTRTTVGTAAVVALGLFFVWRDLNAQGIENRRFFEQQTMETRHQVELLQVEVRALKMVVETASSDRWPRANMKLWRDSLAAMNESVIRVPEIPE